MVGMRPWANWPCFLKGKYMLKYRVHMGSGYDTFWRVWRTDWPSDTFEILSDTEFQELSRAIETGPLKKFNLVSLTEAED